MAALPLALIAFLAPSLKAEDPAPASLDWLKSKVQDANADGRARADAAADIAAQHFEPDTLVPWLRARIKDEDDFHVRLALAYALAAQGEVDGLRVLIDALGRTGHLGYVYLQRVSEQRIGGSDVGWDQPAWEKWLAGLDPASWKELQRKKHLPRTATDADGQGFARAVAWWDRLGLPDVAKAPFVRVTAGSVEINGTRSDRWEHGFLLKEDAASFTVLRTSLEEHTHLRKPPKGEAPVRFEPADLAKEVAQHLDELAAKERPGGFSDDKDVFGVDYFHPAWRFQGFLLARALDARGSRDLALRVWKHVAEEPDAFQRHGEWSAVALLKGDTEQRLFDLWEVDTAEPNRTWAQALEGYKRWSVRFEKGGDAAAVETVLAKMAAEEAGYASAAQAADKDPAERARRLVLGLPTVRPAPWDAKTPPNDALRRLVEIGYPAVPALRAALLDVRFTKTLNVQYGHKGWIREWWRLMLVRDLALGALQAITQQQFLPDDHGNEEAWAATAARVDAWWQQLQAKGESSVLSDGVLAGNPASVDQAKRLAQRFPAEAFGPIRKAIEAAEESLKAELVKTLAPLAAPDVQTFLLGLAKEGPLGVRMAAAEALHAQKNAAGLTSLLADLPALLKAPPISDRLPTRTDFTTGELIEMLFRLTPAKALARVREILPELTPGFRADVLGKVSLALGYWPSYTPKKPADRPQPPDVWKEAESLVVALVIDDAERGGRSFANGREESNIVGELAAETAVELWAKKYKYDPAASLEVRVAQRYAIVNAWRKAQGLPPVAPPGAPPVVAPADPKAAKPLVDAWLAAAPGAARDAAETAIWAQGLRMLPALKTARKGLKESDPRYAPLDLVVRKTANTLRAATWAKDGPRPNDAFKTLVDGMVGKPLTGRDVTRLLQQLAKETPEGAHGIELQIIRNGNGTGCALTLRLTTEVISWRGGEGGWILSDSGLEHVDGDDLLNLSSWWHDARGPQLDELLLLPEDKDVRVSRSLARAKG